MNIQKALLMMVSVLLLSLGSASAFAQDEPAMTCNDNWRNGNKASHCEIKEQTINAVGSVIEVDGRQNGGVSVKGWDRNAILVRSKIQTYAPTDGEAQSLANEIRVEIAGTRIRAEGPETNRNRNWSVSFEVFVPRRSDLSLKAHNGGINIKGVSGHIEFDTVNGGVSLGELSGNVRGETTNGGVSVSLTGNRWEGEGLNVRTTNGGVSLKVPENYSAHLETSTVNGGMNFDFPITVQGKIERQLSVDLGSGGAPIRANTTNGGISIKRK